MDHFASIKPINILLVEDNPADIRLTQEMFKKSRLKVTLNITMDGEETISYLRKLGKHRDADTPDLILLDLNIPKKDGHSVLADIKADQNIKHIPIIILTTSSAEKDILSSYSNYANSYIIKPVDIGQFNTVMKSLEDFWLTIAKLPKKKNKQ